jgi:hypothetical protein
MGRVVSPGRVGGPSAVVPFNMEQMLQIMRKDQLASEARIGSFVKENCEIVKEAVNSRIDKQECRINGLADVQGANAKILADMQTEIKTLKQKSYSQAAAPPPGGPSRPLAPAAAAHPASRGQAAPADDVTAFEVENLLFFQRRCGVLGGFARDTEDETIYKAMRAFIQHWDCDIVEGGFRVPFALGSTGKLGFRSALCLRGIAAKNRKTPFMWENKPLWLSVAQSYEERLRNKSLRNALTAVNDCMADVEESRRTKARICYRSYSVIVGRSKVASWTTRTLELEWFQSSLATTPLTVSMQELQNLALQA